MLDGTTNTDNQLLTGDAKNTDNRFGWVLTGTASTVNSFGTKSSAVATGISNSSRVENDQNDIFYYLNINHEQPSDTYQGVIIYTIMGGL